MKTLKLRITFLEEALGSGNANKDLHAEYIAMNSADADKAKEELKALPSAELLTKATTVFARDEDDNPTLWDYQLKGFFKDACSALSRVTDSKSKKLKAYKKVIDGLIFPEPRQIKLEMPKGSKIGICTRPLRTSGVMGDRVALASSETVPKGTWFVCSIDILEDTLAPTVMEWLDYGKRKGLLVWRNSGKGKFKYDLIK